MPAAAPEQPPAGRPDRPGGPLVLAACALGLVVAALARLEALPATGLSADLGIQFHLAALTREGQLPVRDFEHAWNVLGWQLQAGLQALAGGRPTLWAWLWNVVAATTLVGLLSLVVGRRHRLPALWLVALTAGTLVALLVPNGKYALPVLWLAVLQPVGRGARPLASVLLRALVAGAMVLTHLELAVMLVAGTALFDLLGARDARWHLRVARVLALVLGSVAAFGAELAVYAELGVDPRAVVDFLVLDRATSGDATTTYYYDLLRPPNVHGALYPATLLVPFVPALWRRLSDTTRLTAALHLSLALVAVRKAGELHIGGASVLLVLLAVLGAWDLSRAADRPAAPRAVTLPLALLGAGWLLGSVLLGFRADSVLALAVLLGLAALGPLAARAGDLPAASAGALLAAAGLAATSVVSLSASELSGPQDGGWDRAVAAGIAADVDRCLGADRRAWVVPEPLGLYRLLDLDNPTPWYLFWPGFAAEEPRVRGRLADGSVPAVLQVGPWPSSVLPVAPVVEQTYALCAEVALDAVPETGLPARTVRLWVDPRRAESPPAAPGAAAPPGGLGSGG